MTDAAVTEALGELLSPSQVDAGDHDRGDISGDVLKKEVPVFFGFRWSIQEDK